MSVITPFPYTYASQIIDRFLNSRISTDHNEADGLSANSEILMKGIVSLLNVQKIFYTRGTLMSIRIPQLPKNPNLYRDWLRALK